MFVAGDTADEVARKNRELYDETSGTVWRLAVYEPVHDGWEFINLGGRRILDVAATRARVGPGTDVLELCSGQGATCRYLAERFGCEVTGVEMNPRQVERARARLAEAPPAIAGRVHLVEGNVLDWRAARPFDAVISVDSLMLVEDLPRLMGNAFQSLRPGGCLSLATIVGTPALDPELRRFAWEMDGMISLPDAAEYREMLRAAGFAEVEGEDFTELAVESSLKMALALEENRDEISRTQGEAVYQGWAGVGQVYLNAFRQRKLGYQLLTARRP